MTATQTSSTRARPYRLTEDVGVGTVTLRSTDRYTGETTTRQFYAHGGYVYEVVPRRANGDTSQQVCSRLEHGGHTLTCLSVPLVDVIRREHLRAVRRSIRDM